MNLLRSIVVLLVAALFALVPVGNAQDIQVNPRTSIHDTGWVDVCPTTSYAADYQYTPTVPTHVATLDMGNRPGAVVASLEFRIVTLVENRYELPVYSYAVGSGYEFHIGNAFQQLCLNQCGQLANQMNGEPTVSLYPGDGVDCALPSPLPNVPYGFNEHFDHHLLPCELALPFNLGVFGPGQHSIDLAGYAFMQEWEHQVAQQSHTYRWAIPRFQMRVRYAIVR